MKREKLLLTQGDIMFAINYRWRWDHWQRTFANFAGCERRLLQHSDEITCKLATAHLVVTMKIYRWMAFKGGMNTNAIAYCQCYSKAEAIRVQLYNRGTRCKRLWNQRCPRPPYVWYLYNPLLGIWLACICNSWVQETYTEQLHRKKLMLKWQKHWHSNSSLNVVLECQRTDHQDVIH